MFSAGGGQQAEELPPIFRGIWAAEDEEDEAWAKIVREHGGCPKFDSKAEAHEFMKEIATYSSKDNEWKMKRGSNPEYPKLKHVFTLLVSWKQLQDHLLPKMIEYDARFPQKFSAADAAVSPGNRFVEQHERTKAADPDKRTVLGEVQRRLDLPFHEKLNRQSTMNTLRYLFWHMRCGIFVMIRQRRVVMFVPFVNKDFKNDWGDLDVRAPGAPPTSATSPTRLQEYYNLKEDRNLHGYRAENVIGKKTGETGAWWANGNIISNEHMSPFEKTTQW